MISFDKEDIDMPNTKYLALKNLTVEEVKIIQSIENAIKKEDKIGIQDIAKQNYCSTSNIVKLSKKLGFQGYSDLVFSLRRIQFSSPTIDFTSDTLPSLIDNYNPEDAQLFCEILFKNRNKKIYILGIGFSDIIADYLSQKLSCYGFQTFRGPHFDIMNHSNLEPSLVIAISKSASTTDVLVPVIHAKENGYDIVLFTSNLNSELCDYSDIAFLIQQSNQRIIAEIPDMFPGKCILSFEVLIAKYFSLFDI